MSMRMSSRLAVGLAVAAVCVSVPSALPGANHHPRNQNRVIYGYAYVNRCPRAGREEAVDRWGMYMCNCTSYVAWALQVNHQRVDWFIRGSMDAWNWPNVARAARFVIDRTPAAGAVAVWPQLAQPFGH